MKEKEYGLKIVRKVLYILMAFIFTVLVCKVTVSAKTKVTYYDYKTGETATYTEKDFLKKYGFQKKKVFYKGYDENGNLRVKLYFNTKTNEGCGITYDNDTANGFIIDPEYGCESRKLYLKDKDSFIPQQDIFNDDGVESWASYLEFIEDYKIEESYKVINQKEKISEVIVTGKSPDDDNERINVIRTIFNYNKKGKLTCKTVGLSTSYYSTAECVYSNYYDKLGRIYYRDAYITHGSIQYMFIYDKNKKTPQYVLSLDNYSDGAVDAHLYKMIN